MKKQRVEEREQDDIQKQRQADHCFVQRREEEDKEDDQNSNKSFRDNLSHYENFPVSSIFESFHSFLLLFNSGGFSWTVFFLFFDA